jgi:putative PIN family toxin of toxin-antitoxin system
MTRVVLDTNILVSALWTKGGNAAKILEMFVGDKINLFYDARILTEYKEVLNRPQFAFSRAKVGEIINAIKDDGIEVIAGHCDLRFDDEDDKMFYEVAKECMAILITGNTRHFPDEPFILTAAEFLKRQ